jgi:hypothetical protein
MLPRRREPIESSPDHHVDGVALEARPETPPPPRAVPAEGLAEACRIVFVARRGASRPRVATIATIGSLE